MSNEALFKPTNDKLLGKGKYDFDITKSTLKEELNSAHFNLYTAIFYHFIKRRITIYSPFNLSWFEEKDNGFLKYPITGEAYGSTEDGDYFTDKKFYDNVKFLELLGLYTTPYPPIAMKSWVDPTQDSIGLDGNVVYYPGEHFWYQDNDIIAYKIREVHEFSKKGKILSKEIKAIAPIVKTMDGNGQVTGEKLLFWLDFNELSEILKNYNYKLPKNENGEATLTYHEYFNQRNLLLKK